LNFLGPSIIIIIILIIIVFSPVLNFILQTLRLQHGNHIASTEGANPAGKSGNNRCACDGRDVELAGVGEKSCNSDISCGVMPDGVLRN
jgi:hypothetical protein